MLSDRNYEGVDLTFLKDRVEQLHPETWKLRREKLIADSKKIYEENMKTNLLITSHDLKGIIDKKLNNPMNKGELFIDISKSIVEQMADHEDMNKGGNLASFQPYDVDQI